MTLDQLMNRLESYRRELGGDAEVRLMTQPAWPLEWAVAGVTSRSELAEAEDADDYDDADEDVVYLCEGRQHGYGTAAAWDVAG